MGLGAIDVCNFDASWSGGPTAWRRMAAVATTYGVAVGHHEEPQVSSHLIASQPHGKYAECFHPDRDPFWWHLIATGPRWRTVSSSSRTRRGSAGSSISTTSGVIEPVRTEAGGPGALWSRARGHRRAMVPRPAPVRGSVSSRSPSAPVSRLHPCPGSCPVTST